MISRFIANTADLLKLKNNIEQVLNFDAALDIPNRNYFLADLKAGLDEISDNNGGFCLVFLDIDDFQLFTECFGGNISREVLKEVTRRLLVFFSDAGKLYRTGSDEFVFLLKGIKNEKAATEFAGKIISSFRKSIVISGTEYHTTSSIGILIIPEHGTDPDDIFSNAYAVIRKAKKIKNTYAVYSSEISDDSSEKIKTINLLRYNISRDKFGLLYQPVLDKNSKIIYAEALIRSTDAANPGIGTPGSFLPMIEEAGFIKEIDNMVVRKVFRDMEISVRNRFNVSLNLSTNQLVNLEYSDFLSSFAYQHGIKTGNIILEVTESRLMENLTTGRESLARLKAQGFTIALDDFGRGFSSLTYLAELPIDMLKIDMRLIQAVPGNYKNEAIAKYIIQMAKSLGLQIVAEGFETGDQFSFFKKLECDLFQGYFFSKPVLLNDLIDKYCNF